MVNIQKEISGKDTILHALAEIAGGFAILMGLFSLWAFVNVRYFGYLVVGGAGILAGIVALPSLYAYFSRRTRIDLSRRMRIVLYVVLVIVSWFIAALFSPYVYG
jgi:hypothetical protein